MEGQLEGILSTKVPDKAYLTQRVGMKLIGWVLIGAVILLTVAGVVGIKMFRDYQYQQQLAAERAEIARRNADAARLADLEAVRIQQALDKALEEDTATVNPDAFRDACIDTILRIPPSIGGWMLQEMTCSPGGSGSLIAIYQLESGSNDGSIGTLETFQLDAKRFGMTFSRVDTDALTANGLVQLNLPPPRDKMTLGELPNADSLATSLLSRQLWWSQGVQSRAYTFEKPKGRAVTYIPPTPDGGQGQPQSVPAEKQYQKGGIRLRDDSILSLPGISLDYRNVSPVAITAKPSPEGYSWELEATYVVRN